jgi:uncharacterized membrane protein
MSAAAPQDAQEERIATLERRLEDAIGAVEEHLWHYEVRLQRMESGPSRPVGDRTSEAAGIYPAERPDSADAGRHDDSSERGLRPGELSALRVRSAPATSARRARSARAGDHAGASASRTASKLLSGMSLGDVIGGRVLAWLGGAATLLGILLFLALAISHGWIGEEARVLLAAAASTALMAAGAWLHAHRGRTEAATAMVGTATAGLFATFFVASDVYQLLPGLLAVVGSMLVGALATALAIRWAGRAIGGLGLMGALLSPALVGAPADPTRIALLAVAAACAMCVVVWQRWGWLALGTVIICAPQWATWLLGGQPASVEVLTLALFAALGLLGAVGAQLRSSEERLSPASAAVVALSGCIVAVVGRICLADAAGAAAGNLWLAALAGVHLSAGMCRFRRAQVSPPLRQLLIAIGVTLGDVAFGLTGHGVALAVGWSASAVAFVWLARRTAEDSGSQLLLGLGVGAQIALALIRALLDAPPSNLGSGDPQLLPLLSVSALAASCIACGHLWDTERRILQIALNGLGLVAIAYLTASALGGAALASAWAFEGLALAQLNSRTNDVVTRLGARAFVGAAAFHVLVADAPPGALTVGVANLSAAAIALGALASVGVRMGLSQPTGSEQRHWRLIGAAGALLYLASVATITAFQPTHASATGLVLDLTVRQLGQVALSSLWSLLGLGALILGLRRNLRAVRTAGLALLLVAVGKVFLYDLSTLTSVYRVASFIVLGLLLLLGAFAYQRLRPPPLPDMRTLHPSQR